MLLLIKNCQHTERIALSESVEYYLSVLVGALNDLTFTGDDEADLTSVLIGRIYRLISRIAPDVAADTTRQTRQLVVLYPFEQKYFFVEIFFTLNNITTKREKCFIWNILYNDIMLMSILFVLKLIKK